MEKLEKIRKYLYKTKLGNILLVILFISYFIVIASFNEPKNIDKINEIKVIKTDNSSILKQKIKDMEITNYKNINEPLPPIQTKKDIFGDPSTIDIEQENKEMCENFKVCLKKGELSPWELTFKDQKKQFGDLGTRFLLENIVVWVKKFDVDMDGKKEIIVAICGLWGNGCPHKIEIIKGNKIIFEISSAFDIKSINNGDGFIVKWIPNYLNESYCCPTGYIETRFKYKTNKFIPVSKKEIIYKKTKK